jgi:dCMP deaminase
MNNISKYMKICDLIANEFSKCLSRKIGCLILTTDYTIIATGYNGPPRKVNHCNSIERLEWIVPQLKQTHVGDIKSYLMENGWGEKCPRHILKFKSGEGLWACQAGHAERNAIDNCCREGIKIKGCWLVLNAPLPCQECAKSIIGAGITRVVCKAGPDYDAGSRWLLEQAGVEIIQYSEEN